MRLRQWTALLTGCSRPFRLASATEQRTASQPKKQGQSPITGSDPVFLILGIERFLYEVEAVITKKHFTAHKHGWCPEGATCYRFVGVFS